VHPYLESDAGDLFCLAYSPTLETLYVGCQNTTLQWIDLRPAPGGDYHSHGYTPRRNHKFFDSSSRHDHRVSLEPPSESDSSLARSVTIEVCPRWHIPPTHVVSYAHFGYIYCMAVHPSPYEVSGNGEPDTGSVELVTGSGDETVKVRM
jgi:di- and tripeptidase